MFIKKNIQAVEQVLKPRVLKVDEKEFKEDPFFKIIGLGKSGIKDGSVSHPLPRA